MKEIFFALISLLWLPHFGYSQTPLEWKKWFPLQVGNFWQYKIEQDFLGGYWDWYIPRDSVVGNEHYYLLREHAHSLSGNVHNYFSAGQFNHSQWVRYDDSTRSVVALVQKNDSITEEVWRYFTYRMEEEPFEINQKDTTDNFFPASCMWFRNYFLVGQEVLVSQDVIRGVALKRNCWLHVFGVGANLLHNLGLIREGGCEGSCSEISLVYAKVDGKEYGMRKIVRNELTLPVSHKFVLHSVFPNPFVDEVGLLWEADIPSFYQLRIFDVLGREAVAQDLGWNEKGMQQNTLEVRHLPNGFYLVKLINSKGQSIQKRLIKQK
ncbi:MAG: T9SS type A sorting domain-containing protein [Rhodothermia bacterium]|nr:T9SS type A sorting domain-containing protein [Rhodothermia bacterium]